MDVFLDPSAPGKADALYEQFRDGIVSGRLAEGDRLPTSRALAAELGVSRNTVTTVYRRLVAEGFVDGRGSAGSFVSATAVGSLHRDRGTRRPSALSSSNPGVLDASTWSLGGFDSVEPIFDLRTGRPDPRLFPLREWRRAVDGALYAPPTGYGHPAGLPTLRLAVAGWIARSRGVEADADQVLITAGAQQAIDLIARLMLQPGDMVAVEDPGYPPVASLLQSLGARVVPVRVDGEGLVVDEVPNEARLVYVTPSHQSPTGVAMSMARRRALLARANDREMAIVEDDYDTEYRHGERPLEPLHRLDAAGRVIYVGTLSKILSPSLRLGFVVVPPTLVADAVALRSVMDWQPPESAQQAVRTFIVDGHLDRHLRRTRRIYTERHVLVRERLGLLQDEGHLRAVFPSEAGLHIAARLAGGVQEAEVRAAAARRGVALGDFGQCRRRAGPEGMVVGFGATPTDRLPEALDHLAAAVRSVAARSAG